MRQLFLNKLLPHLYKSPTLSLMGNSESKPPLHQWSKDDVAEGVVSLGGPKYEEYAKSIRDSGIDGGLLVSLEEDEEVEEMLDELEITSKIHRKVLRRASASARKSLTRESSENVHDKKDLETNFKGTVTSPPTAIDATNKGTESFSSLDTEASFLAAEKYGLTSYSPPSAVKAFDDISKKIMDHEPNAAYAGIHLVLRDGQHTISSQMRTPNGSCTTIDRAEQGVLDHEKSHCSQLAMDPSRDFVIREAMPEYRRIGETYVGHVIKNDNGDRLGAVCHVSKLSVDDTENDADSLRLLSAEIAAMTEQQLRLREQLTTRVNSLSKQIDNIKKEFDVGNDMKQMQRNNNDPSKLASSGEHKGPPDSSLWPFANTNLASEAEMEHLPPTVFDMVDKLGTPRPPISKNDMARVARVEALGLHHIDPDGPMARQLKGMMITASSLFHYPIVTLTIHNHSTQFSVGCYDSGLKIFEAMDVLRWDSEGQPFCTTYDHRTATVCSYTVHKRSTFIVPDLWMDEAFNKGFNEEMNPVRAYAGAPIITSDGLVVASLCMMDLKPRYDFTTTREWEVERFAVLITQCIENWELRQMMDRLVEERTLMERFNNSMTMLDKKKRDAPTGEVTLILTDIQGSTALWEADAAAMKEALVLHDKIVRKCSSEHNGYEIKTEGDAFHLAFHDPVDAIGFALQAQIELYEAPWSDNILALDDAAADEEGMFRGPRVRMGIHQGLCMPQTNEVSRRASYSGETFRLTKSIEALCCGGQILASAETWRMVSELSEQLGTPQVVDYGEYVLATGDSFSDGIIAKEVVQLIPNGLAFDYFNATGSASQGSNVCKGRRFPQANVKRRLTTSFLDAPNKNGEVTMMFVYPSGTDDYADDLAVRTFSILTKVVRSLLLKVSPPGYECQEDKGKWVIAFESMIPAVEFGLLLLDAVAEAPFDNEVDAESLIRVGIHSGAFSGMGPHPMTGRADYFGPVVNRAARVTAATDGGKVCVGIPVSNSGETPPAPDFGPQVLVNFVGIKDLKGVSTGMALFCCSDNVNRNASRTMNKKKGKAKETDGDSKGKGFTQSLLGSLRGRKGKK